MNSDASTGPLARPYLRAEMSPGGDGTPVRRDGEDVSGAPESGDSDPPRVQGESHVLNLGSGFATMEGVEMMHSREGGA